MDGINFIQNANRDWWTPERVQQLQDLWPTGLTTSEIAARLGTVKNAVVGKALRLNLPKRSSGRYCPVKWSDEPRRGTEPPRTYLPLEAWPSRGECLYPHGDVGDPDFHFCKVRTATPDAPYCMEHLKLCFVPSRPKSRGTERPEYAAMQRKATIPATLILSKVGVE